LEKNLESSNNIAVLISGKGRTLENLNEKILAGSLNTNIKVVIASKKNIPGIDVAKKYANRLEIVERKNFNTIWEFSEAVFKILNQFSLQLVVLAGWIHKLYIPPEYNFRVINIHPALLPLFGGWLYYGDFVHKAVIESKMKFSGCTVHYVTNEYDSGPIIMQEIVAVEENDTTESLAHKVFEKEKELYPKAIKFVLSLQRKQQSS